MERSNKREKNKGGRQRKLKEWMENNEKRGKKRIERRTDDIERGERKLKKKEADEAEKVGE